MVLTHPLHPLRGQSLSVLHLRVKGDRPSVVAELPDRSVQVLPLSWTDRARPKESSITTPQQRLCGFALLELIQQLESWEGSFSLNAPRFTQPKIDGASGRARKGTKLWP